VIPRRAVGGSWWGEFEFKPRETRYWQLGPFSLWVQRTPAEFRVTTGSGVDLDQTALRVGETWSESIPEGHELVRYSVGEAEQGLEIVPLMADRSIIVKSDTTFIVPPGRTVMAYVSSPLWMRAQLLEPKRVLHEEPMLRPSDTWWGPSTLEGELCYAIRTSVRYDLDNLPLRPHRAVSAVWVVNQAKTPLQLDRIRLPIPNLSLFSDTNGRLWTEAVTLVRGQDDDLASVRLEKSPPVEAGPCAKVVGPRFEPEKNLLIRAFAGLLGQRKDRGWF